jgi:hypothetical protein
MPPVLARFGLARRRQARQRTATRVRASTLRGAEAPLAPAAQPHHPTPVARSRRSSRPAKQSLEVRPVRIRFRPLRAFHTLPSHRLKAPLSGCSPNSVTWVYPQRGDVTRECSLTFEQRGGEGPVQQRMGGRARGWVTRQGRRQHQETLLLHTESDDLASTQGIAGSHAN